MAGVEMSENPGVDLLAGGSKGKRSSSSSSSSSDDGGTTRGDGDGSEGEAALLPFFVQPRAAVLLRRLCLRHDGTGGAPGARRLRARQCAALGLFLLFCLPNVVMIATTLSEKKVLEDMKALCNHEGFCTFTLGLITILSFLLQLGMLAVAALGTAALARPQCPRTLAGLPPSAAAAHTRAHAARLDFGLRWFALNLLVIFAITVYVCADPAYIETASLFSPNAAFAWLALLSQLTSFGLAGGQLLACAMAYSETLAIFSCQVEQVGRSLRRELGAAGAGGEGGGGGDGGGCGVVASGGGGGGGGGADGSAAQQRRSTAPPLAQQQAKEGSEEAFRAALERHMAIRRAVSAAARTGPWRGSFAVLCALSFAGLLAGVLGFLLSWEGKGGGLMPWIQVVASLVLTEWVLAATLLLARELARLNTASASLAEQLSAACCGCATERQAFCSDVQRAPVCFAVLNGFVVESGTVSTVSLSVVLTAVGFGGNALLGHLIE